MHSILNSRTKSAAVTCRGGEEFHLTPGRRWIVIVFPPSVMPPFEVVGTAVAMSGTTGGGVAAPVGTP